jgi:predicted nucleotidyltransferase
VVEKELSQLKRALITLLVERGISPEALLLFGSAATGTANGDSDIDLIIVSKSFRNKDLFRRLAMARGMHGELISLFGKPFDILYYSDTEWRQGESLIIAEAKATGKMLYEAA